MYHADSYIHTHHSSWSSHGHGDDDGHSHTRTDSDTSYWLLCWYPY